MDAAYRIFREQGILSFWRGNQVDVFKVPVHEYLHLMIPPIFKKAIVKADIKKESKRYFFESWVAGLAATACYLVFLYPIDVLRVRVATDIGYK
jgi:solute carrier family 25 (adenine nucleotide translocator) protein 4/5/6/31